MILYLVMIFKKKKFRGKILYIFIIRFLFFEDEDDFFFRWGFGDFCNVFILVSELGNEVGGVVDKFVVDFKVVKGKMYSLKKNGVC